MKGNGSCNGHSEGLLPLAWRPRQPYPFRLHVNDYVRINGQLGRVIRVTESAAVVLLNRPHRRFTTRFDREVEFRQPPRKIRIAANSEIEVLNRPAHKGKRGTIAHGRGKGGAGDE